MNSPNYPHVVFVKKKTILEKNGESVAETHRVEELCVRVDGCHGDLENLNNFLRHGMRPIRGHKLESRPHIARWLSTMTGEGVDPDVRAAEAAALDEKIKRARDAFKK